MAAAGNTAILGAGSSLDNMNMCIRPCSKPLLLPSRSFQQPAPRPRIPQFAVIPSKKWRAYEGD